MPINVDPNRVLLSPQEIGRISAKNSRTIVKIVQLLEVQNTPTPAGQKQTTAESIDKEGFIKARIEKLKQRLNRRLKKCANWSDERIGNRMPLPEKKRKMEAAFKVPYPYCDQQKWTTVLTSPNPPVEDNFNSVNTQIQAQTQQSTHIIISAGSMNSYTDEFSSQLLEKGEVFTAYRASAHVPATAVARAPGTGGSTPGSINSTTADTWKYITEKDIKDMEGAQQLEQAQRRRKLDSDHRFYLKRKTGVEEEVK